MAEGSTKQGRLPGELAKASETKFRFPMLAYIPGGELCGYPDQWWMTVYRRHLLESGIYDGMLLIDANRRRWVVRRAHLVVENAHQSWWQRWLGIQPKATSVDFEIEETDKIEMSELTDLVCRALEEERRLWRYANQITEHSFQQRLTTIRSAKTVGRIFRFLELEIEPGFWWGHERVPKHGLRRA